MKWVVYMMTADAGGGFSFCKIAITTDMAKRVKAVQTGCPMPITDIAYLDVPQGRPRPIEKMFHDELRKYHTHGEWFRFNLSDPEHKAVVAAATKKVISYYGASETRWKHMDMAAVALMCRALRLDEVG